MDNKSTDQPASSCLACCVKISAGNIFEIFFFQKIDFDLSCKLSPLETICMRGQSLFLENQEQLSLSSAELTQGVVKVKKNIGYYKIYG